MGDPKLWAIVRREYLERVRTRWFVIGTFLTPIFLAIMVFLPIALAVPGDTHGNALGALGQPNIPSVITANEAKILFATFVSFFLYVSIILYGQSMLSGVIEEKLTRVAEVVISSVKPETLFAGKVLGISAVGLTQQAIWIVSSVALFTIGDQWFNAAAARGTASSISVTTAFSAALVIPAWWVALVVIFFLLGFVFFGSLYAAAGATVSSESEARQAAQPLIFPLIMTVVFIQPVMSHPNDTLARVLSMIPFCAPILMPLRMAIGNVPALEVVASLVLLTLACGGAVWAAARIYRVGLLMYGKRPTLLETLRWIRE